MRVSWFVSEFDRVFVRLRERAGSDMDLELVDELFSVGDIDLVP